jgi:hypothetical protein
LARRDRLRLDADVAGLPLVGFAGAEGAAVERHGDALDADVLQRDLGIDEFERRALFLGSRCGARGAGKKKRGEDRENARDFTHL